ncbi:MAG: cell wall metabolism sensor histidine kinase WalK, partial [Proteobacteria bacterium]|nr:cell wall metabolism sensor histidine kinase WalK [Pseudomonadota bacterium]
DQNKLFRLDVNHSTPGTEEEKGTGLGLILCKEMVDKHGGKIWVESEKSVGTSFYFSLHSTSPS